MDQFGAFNERYAAAFAEPRPARSAFQVARLPFDANVEIEAWAFPELTAQTLVSRSSLPSLAVSTSSFRK